MPLAGRLSFELQKTVCFGLRKQRKNNTLMARGALHAFTSLFIDALPLHTALHVCVCARIRDHAIPRTHPMKIACGF